jgi:uncharacterized membrane protein SpoIIM required for sporulation
MPTILEHPKLPQYLLLSGFILLLGFGIAYILNPPSQSVPFNFTGTPVMTMTNLEAFQAILIKNLIATFLMISLGILNIGIMSYIGHCIDIDLSKDLKTLPERMLNSLSRIFPITALFINGYVIGRTIFMLNYDPIIVFSTIFPHGYIEFPMLLFVGSCSFIIIDELQETGLDLITLVSKHNNPKVRYILKNYLFYPYILMIIPCVIIAAIIEATFSYWNLRLVIGV